jgi:hypothetical protein
MRHRWFFIITGILFVALTIAALAAEPIYVVPVLVVAAIVFAYWAFNKRLTDQTMADHGNDPEAALSDDQEGGLPKTHLMTDDSTPLGDNPDLHSEISPHDLPPGSDQRRAVEAMAAEEGGTTAGHADPSSREGRVERTPGKEEGYPEGDPSSEQGKQAGSPRGDATPTSDTGGRGTLNQP